MKKWINILISQGSNYFKEEQAANNFVHL